MPSIAWSEYLPKETHERTDFKLLDHEFKVLDQILKSEHRIQTIQEHKQCRYEWQKIGITNEGVNKSSAQDFQAVDLFSYIFSPPFQDVHNKFSIYVSKHGHLAVAFWINLNRVLSDTATLLLMQNRRRRAADVQRCTEINSATARAEKTQWLISVAFILYLHTLLPRVELVLTSKIHISKPKYFNT